LEGHFASRLPAQPVSDLFQRVTRHIPSHADIRWQLLVAIALLTTWFWLGDLERWWLQRGVRLPK
jgi:hypothetical protein